MDKQRLEDIKKRNSKHNEQYKRLKESFGS